METQATTFICPTCGKPLAQDSRTFRCDEHGLWHLYGAHLLVHVPSGEHRVRDRFTMPWEAAARKL